MAQQSSRTMVLEPVAPPPDQPARGRGQAARGGSQTIKGRCEPMCRYIFLITESELEQLFLGFLARSRTSQVGSGNCPPLFHTWNTVGVTWPRVDRKLKTMDEDEDGGDDDCLLVARKRGSTDASNAPEPMVVSLHRQAFSKSWAELARYKAELKNSVEERDVLKHLYVQREKEVRDLRVELANARPAERRASIAASRRAQDERDEILVWSRKIEELEAKSAAELAKAKSEAEAFVSSYRDDTEAANTWAHEISITAEVKLSCALDHAKRQSRRETLEEVHARGFDLLADIEKAKTLKEEAVALLSDDEDSASGSGSGGDEDEVPEEEIPEDAAPDDAALEDVASKYVVPEDVAPK
uniref:Uncharacterized protein n=1 Tax=Nicotiana tabacum TaxID=4097 RepID=A0A1S4AJ25_TOBAC|nr:PREDICTED: uncharacterized protein LOC107798008 [Nicotiana tabacum]